MQDFRAQLRQDFKDYPADAVAPMEWFMPETHERILSTANDDTFDEVEQIKNEKNDSR